MKLNKISMFLAAIALVGCSNEDFNDFNATQAIEDSRLIELDSNFILAGVGVDNNSMRTHWEQDATTGALVNKFLPIWGTTAPTAGNTIDDDAVLSAQAVGLCWLGQGSVGTDVYTNYEFYHFGWLNKDETEADYDCNGLYNGALYDEITIADGTANAEAIPGTDWTVAGLPTKSVKAGEDNLNYNSGVYKTENKAIFGGQYIVYYPYDADFKDAGTIPANAVTNWADVPTNWQSQEIGHATFRYSAPVEIKGGNNAADFGLYNLSSIAQLRVSTVAGDASIGDNVDQIILYSASQKLLKKAYLAADKIASGATGADLYADTEGTKTIVATLTTPIALAATPAASAYITVLPTTVDDLVALVHNSTDGTWAEVDMANTVFPAGSAKRYDIVVKDANFTSDFIAVDQASLLTALTAANTAVNTDPTATPTITVIGDITLISNLSITADEYPNIAKITITGDDIIVPENVTLTLNNNNADVNRMESNIRVLGKSCCSNSAWTGGRLIVTGGTIGNVTMEKTEARVATPTDYDNYNPQVTYQNAAVVVAGKTDVKAGNVVVDAAVQHKGDIAIAEDAKLTVSDTGDIKFVVSGDSQILNDGTIEVIGGGKFDITNISGTTTATDGQKMTNNGKFIHNVNAEVGTTVQSMNQNGEYRCKVANQNQLGDAYLQWTACNIIEMVNNEEYSYDLGTAASITPAAYKHNGKYIDIEVNTPGYKTTFNNPGSPTNGDSKDIAIGNLTVAAGELDIDYVQGTGKRTLTVNGDMTVKATTTITDSKKITVTENLTVEGATLTYKGDKKNEGGLAVTKDINVNGATFEAQNDALNITCANFYLTKVGTIGGTATFGNRTASTSKNLVVSGTISNLDGCTFNILAASGTDVYAWVTCTELVEGGTFSAARPRVVAAN